LSPELAFLSAAPMRTLPDMIQLHLPPIIADHPMAQAVSGCIFNAAAQIHTQVSTDICGGQSGAGAGNSMGSSFFKYLYQFTTAPYSFTYHLHDGQWVC
jgi:hypothetical protein